MHYSVLQPVDTHYLEICIEDEHSAKVIYFGLDSKEMFVNVIYQIPEIYLWLAFAFSATFISWQRTMIVMSFVSALAAITVNAQSSISCQDCCRPSVFEGNIGCCAGSDANQCQGLPCCSEGKNEIETLKTRE